MNTILSSSIKIPVVQVKVPATDLLRKLLIVVEPCILCFEYIHSLQFVALVHWMQFELHAEHVALWPLVVLYIPLVE